MKRVIGLDRLAAKLRALPEKAELAIRKAMEQSADEMVGMMKRLAPVDDGDLQMSIAWTWGEAPKGSMTIGKIKQSGSGSRLSITIYAGGGEAYYARFVEFGTAAHINGGMFAGSRNPGTRAQPFFFVGYRANRKRTKSNISRAITRAAKQVASGG